MPRAILVGALLGFLLLPSWTTAQTLALVKDINQTKLPNPSSGPSRFVRAGNRVFFVAWTSATGRELYVTRGLPFVVLHAFVPTSSGWNHPFPLANDTRLVGVAAMLQAWFLSTTTPLRVETTNGVALTLGR